MRSQFTRLASLAFWAVALPLFAQTYCPPDQICPPGFYPIQNPGFTVAPAPFNLRTESIRTLDSTEEVNVDQWYQVFTGPGRQPTPAELALAEKIKFSAVRIYQGNGCGSGSLCGRDSQYIYIKTNAHVASTRIGSQSRCQAVVGGRLQEFRATLIEVAYSSRDRVDWGLLRADAKYMQGIEPVPLAITMPSATAPTILWGHPRCVPTRGRALETVSLSRVWYKRNNATGGESGSAVVQAIQDTPVQVGLTTWSERVNNVWLHSSQFTAAIYQQSANRTNVGEPRTGNETIPQSWQDNPLGVVLEDGYAVAGDDGMKLMNMSDNPLGVQLESKWACIGNPMEVSLRNYPIWFDPSSVPPVDEEEEGEDEEENEDEDQDEIEPAPPEPKWMFRKRADVMIATDGTHIVTIIGDIEEFLKAIQ